MMVFARSTRWLLLFGVALVPVLASAQAEPPPPPPEPNAEPATEAPAAQPAPAAAPGEKLGQISLKEWQDTQWDLVQPKVTLLELHGYMRMRGDMLRKLDFDNDSQTELVPRYAAATDGHANFTSTNMRLRLEPHLNVTDDIRAIVTFDVLDGMQLGSTPNSPYNRGSTTASTVPMNLLSDGQSTAEKGINTAEDVIRVKRAYGVVKALNEQLVLEFGRLPMHWGLGMMTNAGDCLDCNFGDVSDRLAVTFKAADMLFTPAYDWVSVGPSVMPFGRSGGQSLDAVTWDDVEQYSLQIQRLDKPNEVRERVLAGEAVVNYGVWGIWRRQFRDLPDTYYTSATPTVSGVSRRRDGNILTGDGYFRLHWSGLELAIEGAIMYGGFDDTSAESAGGKRRRTSVYQLGGALDATWRFSDDYKGTAIGLKTGVASGDSAPYFGALDQAGSQRGPVGGKTDLSLDNFQFSPDYHVDLLLFRHIIGTVTDAWYLRPELRHTFENNIGLNLGAVYSQAIFKKSTQSKSRPLGVEGNLELSYGGQENPQVSGFRAALAGGALFPLGGFKNLTLANADQGGSFAWTLQGRLYITF